MQVPVFSVSKGFPVASKDRGERAHYQAKKTGKIEEVPRAIVGTGKVKTEQCFTLKRSESFGVQNVAHRADLRGFRA